MPAQPNQRCLWPGQVQDSSFHETSPPSFHLAQKCRAPHPSLQVSASPHHTASLALGLLLDIWEAPWYRDAEFPCPRCPGVIPRVPSEQSHTALPWILDTAGYFLLPAGRGITRGQGGYKPKPNLPLPPGCCGTAQHTGTAFLLHLCTVPSSTQPWAMSGGNSATVLTTLIKIDLGNGGWGNPRTRLTIRVRHKRWSTSLLLTCFPQDLLHIDL